MDDWMQAVGFEAVQTENNWWSNQVTRAQKPLPVNSPDWSPSGDVQVAMG